MNKIINKTMDLNDLKTKEGTKFINQIKDFIGYAKNNNINISSWYGNLDDSEYYKKISILNKGYDYIPILDSEDDIKYPNYLLWEIYWVEKNMSFKKNDKILDIGGANSLFSLYLAYKGMNVVAIDINEKLVKQANNNSKILNLKYVAYTSDAEEYLKNSDEKFNYITSICVFEHIEINKRKRIIHLIHNNLYKNGKIAFTFDYKNPSRFININTPDDIINQFLDKKYFNIIKNKEFHDNNINYLIHPFYRKPIIWKYKIKSIKKGNFSIFELFKTKDFNDYTFGAIFMKKK